MNKGVGWPIGVATILVLVVAANVWVAIIANRDPSFAIEPDYYAKAVAWDSSMAQARHNATLNWSLTPTLGAFARRQRRHPARTTDGLGRRRHSRCAHSRRRAVQCARVDGLHGYAGAGWP